MQDHFYNFIDVLDNQWDSLSLDMHLDYINTLTGIYITGVQKEVRSTPCTKLVEMPFPTLYNTERLINLL
jgi:hypothetical protein